MKYAKYCLVSTLVLLILPCFTEESVNLEIAENKSSSMCVTTREILARSVFNSSHFVEYRCINGKWIIQIYDNFSPRNKRQANPQDILNTGASLGAGLGAAIGGPIGSAIGSAAGSLLGGIVCIFICKQESPPQNKPPVISCNEIDITDKYTAPNGRTTLQISLPTVEGQDPEDGKIEVKSTPESPVTLARGTNIILFQGHDSEGLTAFCAKTIQLRVVTCDQPQWPDHGYVRCQHGEVLMGTSCSVTCQDGYELKGSSTLTCIEENTYDHPPPLCSQIHCSNTTQIQPQHGNAHCDDLAFPYGTVCLSNCNNGYGTSSMIFSKCKHDKQWSNKLPPCEDKEPPSFTFCPSTIHAYADKGKDLATAIWRNPEAKDNSGKEPIITLKTDLSPGSLFNSFSEVRYTATDDEGNESPPCTFFIMVEKQFCDPPVFNDGYIKYTCGKDGYQYGSECDLSCRGSYPLVGNNKITCEKNNTSNELYWDWGDQGKPYCKQNKCPALTPPKNGALSCDQWMFGTQCAMQCNSKYDIPLGVGAFTGLFTCSTVVGKWSPDLIEVPGCTALRVGNNHRLPGELVYVGDCNDATTKMQIKQNFVSLMEKMEMDPGFTGVCPNKNDCNVENVEVICGSSRRRRRYSRNSNGIITLTFEFIKKYEPYGNSTISAMNHAKEQFAVIQNITSKIVNQGLFDVPNVEIDKSSLKFGEVEFDCGPGRVPKFSTLTCAACALGTYLDDTTKTCIKCPSGSYKEDEEALDCTICPTGTSTTDTGAINVTECKETCKPGYFSLNGLVPCSPCPLGTYVSTAHATQCINCGDNKSTKLSGSFNISDCINFDVHLESADETLNLRPSAVSLQTMSLSFWCKRTSENSTIEITIGDTDGLKLLLNSKMELFYARQQYSSGIDFEKNTWIHVGAVLDASSKLHLYKGGNDVFSTQVVANTILLYMAHFKSRQGNDISGFIITENPLTGPDLQKMSRECNVNVLNPLLTTNDMRQRNSTAFQTIIPSVCDAVDECFANPCNDHICLNGLPGYRCICSDGYTGQSCEIPPDFCKNNECENGATCENGKQNYSCSCPMRLKGTFCEIAPVDGGWTSWGDWWTCSVSCGGGTTNRYRNCTNPAPGPDGIPCFGNTVETDVCNTFDCPSCPRTPSSYGVRMLCNSSGDTTVCKAVCREGLAFAPGHKTLDEYICGRSTNYLWNGHPPSCSKISSPSTITVDSAIQYPDFPCSKVDVAKREIYNNAKNNLQCGKNGTCEIHVEIKGCEARQKRSTSVEAVITLTIALANGDNLDLDKYMSNNIISPAFVNLMKAVADLESSAQAINKTGHVFQVSGVKIDLQDMKIQTSSQVKCAPGKIRLEVFCVDCPTGTYSDSKGTCVSCKFGTFQDEPGQTMCKPCPDGYSTPIVGSQSIDLCTVPKTTGSLDDFGDSNAKSTSVVVITVSVVATIVVVIGILVAVIVRKQMRIKYRKQNMGSSISFNMVKPTEDSRKPALFFHKA